MKKTCKNYLETLFEYLEIYSRDNLNFMGYESNYS